MNFKRLPKLREKYFFQHNIIINWNPIVLIEFSTTYKTSFLEQKEKYILEFHNTYNRN